jgi:CBS domain-containing membrane protein
MDFLGQVSFDTPAGFASRMRNFLRPTPRSYSDKAEVVGQIMTRRVQVISQDRSLASVVPVFSSTGHHRIPVVDDELRLVGMLTQTDLVRALAEQG